MDLLFMVLLTLVVVVFFARAVYLCYRDLREEESRVIAQSAFLKDKGWILVGTLGSSEMWYRARTDSMHERSIAFYIAQAEDFQLQARQRAREAYRKEHQHGGVRYRNFYQAIVKPDTLVFGQGVKFPEVTIQPLGKTRPTPEGVYSTPKRPPMTRELPKVKGWYWRVNADTDNLEVVHVGQDLDGRILMESTDSDGTIVVDLVLRGKWWSAEPIAQDELPQEAK